MSERIKFPTTSNNSLAQTMTFFNSAKIKVKFHGGCFKHEKITFYHGNIVNVYMVYEINLSPNDLDSTFALLNSLFGTIKLSKNADPGKFLILDAVLELFHC